ncbi:MAG: divergent polysaccharide deacetylase family protein [Deltaproteobacteria bacterium]|nr:divergent polysaccharide deacetylase family protein [Deltaproteobacteria bacterium]
MSSPKQRNNRIREPRKGALAVTVIVALLVVFVALAAYFLYRPIQKTDVPMADNIGTPSKAVSGQPYVHSTSAVVIPPDTQQKPARDQLPYPKADSVLPDEAPISNNKPGSGRLAIIIDDMGSSMSEARSLAAIGVPLSFSVIPGLRKYREVAQFAESSGIEVMVHIPMQSKGWPERRLEANGLLLSMDDAELRERVAGFLREIPGAVGANNHMGSEFTEHADKMRSVLEVLKNRNLFFVDSVTSTQTIGLRVARELGMKSGRRHVFLDNEQELAYILGQLGQAVKLAKKNGFAIAICHPHPETIATLAAALPGLAGQGIALVSASQLVR